ncbi:MAG: fused MFS/spermidine synthase [Planctomycetota bacterium]
MPRRNEPDSVLAGAQGLWRLKAAVFLCGAALMSLEMVGVRILNVYFGSTIYVWGAIIGIFLGALSLGYWLGGILADRSPRLPVLGVVILLSAASIFVIPWLAKPLCLALGRVESFGPRLQALLGSLALYFVPSVLMGMVSPFAVRLAAQEVRGLGRVAGRLYALSTLGSIAGTFLTAFVLVEFMGTRATVLSLGALLVLTALVTLERPQSRLFAAIGGACLAVPAYYGTRGSSLSLPGDYAILEEFDSAYHHVIVARGTYEGVRSNVLFFNRLTQSAIELDEEGNPRRPVVSTCGYTDMLHLGMLFRDRPPKSLLVIGGGGGVGPMVFRQDYADLERIDVVEIDPGVLRMARKHFGFPAEGSDPAIRAHVKDGRLFVQASRDRYDYIVLDAFSGGGRIPGHLLTREFFEGIDRILAPGGVVVLNVIAAIEGQGGALFRAVLKTLEAVYPQVYVFPRDYHGKRMENVIFVATRAGERVAGEEVLRRAAWKIRREEIRRKTVQTFASHLVTERHDLSRDPLLTDDFAPLDKMALR